jgi:hypothetical protein
MKRKGKEWLWVKKKPSEDDDEQGRKKELFITE